MTARVSMLKSRASPDMLPFSFCNKTRLAIRHMNRPLFPTKLSIPSYDTIDSVLRYREIGRVKDLSAPPSYISPFYGNQSVVIMFRKGRHWAPSPWWQSLLFVVENRVSAFSSSSRPCVEIFGADNNSAVTAPPHLHPPMILATTMCQPPLPSLTPRKQRIDTTNES